MFFMLQKYKLPVALSILGIVLITGGVVASNISPKKQFPKESLINSERIILIDVSGAVNKPGVYKLKDGERIEDAINTAGGFAETASGEYISKILNMAQKLVDGTKLYIPAVGEEIPARESQVAGVKTQSQVNINTATQSELEALPGIGPVTASKIISDRPYNTVEDLLSKKILGKAIFDKIKDSITVY